MQIPNRGAGSSATSFIPLKGIGEGIKSVMGKRAINLVQ